VARRRKLRGRPVNGILLLDKPIGSTSNGALQEVKRLFFAQKAGHTGNLDPMASGLLPLCFGEATKLSAYLLDADKAYEGTATLGKRTTTADTEGEVIDERPVGDYSDALMAEVLARFTGPIEQVPPMYSALKHQGQPLYKLAREGVEVERKPRTVTIHELVLRGRTATELELGIHCTKGTYVRTLVEDIGEALGCGAHLSALRRTRVGAFDISAAVSLDEVRRIADEEGSAALDRLLIPFKEVFADWPAVQLTETLTFYLRQGQPVIVPQAPTGGMVKLLDQDGDFLGVGEILDDGRVAPRRLLQIQA